MNYYKCTLLYHFPRRLFHIALQTNEIDARTWVFHHLLALVTYSFDITLNKTMKWLIWEKINYTLWNIRFQKSQMWVTRIICGHSFKYCLSEMVCVDQFNKKKYSSSWPPQNYNRQLMFRSFLQKNELGRWLTLNC